MSDDKPSEEEIYTALRVLLWLILQSDDDEFLILDISRVRDALGKEINNRV